MTPLRAVHYPENARLRQDRIPGSIWIAPCCEGEASMLWFVCPCGCGTLCNISIGHRHKPKMRGPSWYCNGSATEATLDPSVNAAPAGDCNGWHGWLRDGYWEAC